MEFLIILVALIVISIVLPPIGIYLEKKEFNNGVCPWCNRNLILFDIDSHGGRGYECKGKNCNYYAWVSYKCVDKNFR